jgi:hypothetical protein
VPAGETPTRSVMRIGSEVFGRCVEAIDVSIELNKEDT